MAQAVEKKLPAPAKRSSKALKQIASLIEDSMEGLPESEKDRRVTQFETRVEAAISRRAKSS
jgi:hypothetical protein